MYATVTLDRKKARSSPKRRGVNEWKRRSGKTRFERGRLAPRARISIDVRAIFSIYLRRYAALPNFCRGRACMPRHGDASPIGRDVFPTGCCILNVFTLASDPDRSPSHVCAARALLEHPRMKNIRVPRRLARS